MISPIYRAAHEGSTSTSTSTGANSVMLGVYPNAREAKHRQDKMRRSSATTATESCYSPLCNGFSTQIETWMGVERRCLSGCMEELDHSSAAAAVLSSRVWIDTSMRHQNGRSRAAVASSLLSSLVLLALPGPLLDKASLWASAACQLTLSCPASPIRSVTALCLWYIRVLISIAKRKNSAGTDCGNATAIMARSRLRDAWKKMNPCSRG